MPSRTGRAIRLSLPRRWIHDLLHFARQLPTVPVQREFQLLPLLAARQDAAVRVSWSTLFLKAYGLLSARVPELRQAFLTVPVARLYEFPTSVASLAVERDYHGEKAVFFARIRAPEEQTLLQLEAHYRRFRTAPLDSVGAFRRLMSVSRLPQPVRRLLWWAALNLSGARRAERMGTFGVSVYSGLGAESLHPLSPLTTTLNYGVIGPDGRVPVRVVYDHRVMDGATVARALAELEAIMNSVLVAELHALRPAQAA